jgi:hydroxyacylglutathione hydrolase
MGEWNMKLNQSLYAYVWKGNDNNCNSYLFAGVFKGGKHILIDPGHIVTPYYHEEGYQRLVQEIESDGLKIQDIGLVILTHGHPDHIEAAGKFKTLYGIPVALNKDDLPEYEMFGRGSAVDVQLEEGPLKVSMTLLSPIEILKVPGHSAGHVAVYWPSQKALAAGDVVFYRSMGRIDLPGGDEVAMKASIDKLAGLDVEYLFCGHPYGHPGVIQGREAIKQNFDILKEYFRY